MSQIRKKAGGIMKYSKEEVLQYMQEEDVKFIRLAFCDVFGKQKNISIMPQELSRAFEHGIAIDASAIAGFGDESHSDLFLHPDPDTLMPLPWRPEHGRVVRMFCSITYPDGTIFECDTRSLLKKAVQEAKSGCEYYQCDIPVVFTNNTFSSAAINLAKNTNVELWDQDTLYHYLKKSKILTKSLPLYYPLFTFITTAILSYYYLQHQDYLLIPLLINMFLFISIIVKILKDKKKTPIILKEPEYTIHDYHDTIQ